MYLRTQPTIRYPVSRLCAVIWERRPSEIHAYLIKKVCGSLVYGDGDAGPFGTILKAERVAERGTVMSVRARRTRGGFREGGRERFGGTWGAHTHVPAAGDDLA